MRRSVVGRRSKRKTPLQRPPLHVEFSPKAVRSLHACTCICVCGIWCRAAHRAAPRTNTNTNTKYTCDTGQTRNKLLAQWVHLAPRTGCVGVGGHWCCLCHVLACVFQRGARGGVRVYARSRHVSRAWDVCSSYVGCSHGGRHACVCIRKRGVCVRPSRARVCPRLT